MTIWYLSCLVLFINLVKQLSCFFFFGLLVNFFSFRLSEEFEVTPTSKEVLFTPTTSTVMIAGEYLTPFSDLGVP